MSWSGRYSRICSFQERARESSLVTEVEAPQDNKSVQAVLGVSDLEGGVWTFSFSEVFSRFKVANGSIVSYTVWPAF